MSDLAQRLVQAAYNARTNPENDPWMLPRKAWREECQRTAQETAAAVLREAADGLCCGGVLYDLADEIEQG